MFPYNRQKRKIIEKLDEEDQYAAIHYAVLSNNLFACDKLIKTHKCSKD
jgi:hypothetical protein